jgi:putative endonuclease
MSYVYMVRCRDGSFYCGYAENVKARVAAHNAGLGAKYTKGRCPVTLAYSLWVENRSQAQQIEAQLKRLPRKKKSELCDGWSKCERNFHP